jgi:penicillin-binding protein 2
MPSTRWKQRLYREKWYAGETISVSIGQGATTVTPIQLATAIGGMSVGGIWHTPHLVRDSPNLPPARKAHLNLENVSKVIDGMYGVVNEIGGTAYADARIPGISVCGKTGSAQVVSNEYLKGRKADKELEDNGWFVGFAPKESPEIVVVALIEHGLHGSAAAPIVRDVIKAYYDKKARLNHDKPVEARAVVPSLLESPVVAR